MKNCIRFLLTGILLFSFHVITFAQATLGDVNGDSQVNIVDALILAQYCVGLNPQVFILEAADADGNGTINIVDALVIAQYYVGLINILPPGTSTPHPTPQVSKNMYTLTIQRLTTEDSACTMTGIVDRIPQGEPGASTIYYYAFGETVNLTARYYADFTTSPHRLADFDHWEGDVPDGNFTGSSIDVVMDRDKSVTAYYRCSYFNDVP